MATVSYGIKILVDDYGADPTGVADSSTAIAAAIVDATASGINHIEFGKGVYKCNFVVPENLTISGKGGGLFVNFTLPTAPYDTDNYPTVLKANSTASPVIRVNSIYGVHLRDFAVFGGGSQLGTGISLDNNSAYCGSNMTLSRVRVTGFSKGFHNRGGVDVTHNECMYTGSVHNVYMEKAADNLAPSDTNNFINCVTGGSDSTWNFYLKSCRGITIMGGDHNLADHIMYMDGGSVVNILNLNSEQIQEHLFELNAGDLNIMSGRFSVASPGGNKELIRVTGTTVNYTIGNIIYDGTGSSFLSSSYGTLVKTAGTEYPKIAPFGYLIQRYTSTAFTTLKETEFTSRIFAARPVYEDKNAIIDEFVQGYTTPFGQLGWTITTVKGSGGTGRFPSSDIQSLSLGGLEIVTTSGSGNDIFRLGMQKNLFSANLFPEWEAKFDINLSNATNSNFKAGLCSDNISLTVSNATNATPIVVTTGTHGLSDGMLLTIASVGGNTAANGNYYVDVLSSTTFALYSDSGLTTPVAGSGAYTSGGTAIAQWPAYGIMVACNGVADTNLYFETIVAGVITRVDTGVAKTAIQSSSTATRITIRRLKNTSDVLIGYSCQVGDNPEVFATGVTLAGYLTAAFYLGSANANFATARFDKFYFRN